MEKNFQTLSNHQLQQIAEKFEVSLPESAPEGLDFVLEDDYLKIYSVGEKPIFIDYDGQVQKFKQQFQKTGIKKEPLARAIGKEQKVIDATCGMAKDTCYFLALGKRVVAYERNPWVVLLLKQNLDIAKQKKHFNLPLEIEYGTVSPTNLMGEMSVVYYDPMYQEVNKKALPQKNMRIFRDLVGVDSDAMEFAKQLREVSTRLVIKRPIKSAPLLEKVGFDARGKSTRYDVYL